MKAVIPKVTVEDRDMIEKLLSAGHIQHKYARRLMVVAKKDAGKSVEQVACETGVSRSNVSAIINRYNQFGLGALLRDKTRKPGKPPVSVEVKNAICAVCCKEKPENATHWSLRELAKRFHIGKSTVQTILHERDIKPHLEKTFRFSTDSQFKEKLTDVVGLYMNPPDNAIVLCVDEKSQIQALERTAPLLPLGPHVPASHSADYYRHGTTTLFAALDMLTGNVKGVCKPKHRSSDFLAFLRKLSRECEKGKKLHIILDNYSAHKSKETTAYLAKHKRRFALHFIPTHSSWLNMVERWFAEITNKRIRRESWESVEQLTAAIKAYITGWNKSGRKFCWTKSADTILASIQRRREVSIV